MKRTLKSDCAWYHSIQNILSSHLLSKSLKIRICKTIIFLAILYGCETLSQTLGGTQTKGAEVSFWTSEGDVTGAYRKVHNEELCDLYSSPHVIR
jgi:hypothetical protein